MFMGKGVSDSQGIVEITYELPVALDVGEYNIRADVGDIAYYNEVSNTTKLTVLPRLDVRININQNMYVKGVLASLTDSNGDKIINKKVSVKIASVTYSLSSDGNGDIVLPDAVKAGSYQISVTSPAEGKYNSNISSLNILVVNPIVKDKDYSVYYGNTVKYKVRVFDTDGKGASGKTVVFKINGKTASIKTDKSGYAVYSVKLGVGKYTVTAQYNGFSVSNKITFKSTLSAKNIVVKKAKKIKFSVKAVNKNGKAVKNKKITFKIKGKKYTAKTNRKGVATASIKNLKAGKYTVISSY